MHSPAPDVTVTTAPSPTTEVARPLALLLTAIPVALGLLLALHPLVAFDPFALEGRLGRWFAVHYGMLALLPALGGVGWSVLNRFTGRLALLGRGSLLVFVGFYAAYDALAGIGTGMLIDRASALDAGARDAIAPLLTDWWVTLNPHWIATVGMLAWAVFAICAVVLHRRAGAHPLAIWGLAIGGMFALAHGSVPATATLVAFAAGVWAVHRPAGPSQAAHRRIDR